jgi:hypothetical protein
MTYPRVEWREDKQNLGRSYPISAKIIVRRFDGRMAFAPEGQADRSQARSAGESVPQKIRPGGYGPIERS